MTRRRLQIALGLLWLLDAGLQAQPFMFTRGFATQVVAAGGRGQPGFVAEPVHWAATVIGAHPVAWNLAFFGVQLVLGLGLLVPRTARAALAASIAWALGVWYLGEGLSGMASGQASLTTGAPGSALLLAILAAAAWPDREGSEAAPAPWLPVAWAVVWVGGAVFEALPAQGGGALLVAAEYLTGLGALARITRVPALTVGLALALAFWVDGQDFGGLAGGHATDPNSGVPLALMAVALMPAAVTMPWPGRAPQPLPGDGA
jgi:hypothetical protein